MLKKNILLSLPIALAVTGAIAAQAPEDVLDRLVTKSGNSAYLTQSPQNRTMMPDNPAYMVADDGEKLFKEKRGPKNASLEQCDFGLGPGVVKGAYAQLPRYFADVDQVRLRGTAGALHGHAAGLRPRGTGQEPVLRRRPAADRHRVDSWEEGT